MSYKAIENYKQDLIQKFYDYEIIKRQGPKYPDGFLLKSGVRSDLYINIRDLIKFPSLFNFTMHCMHQLICDTYQTDGGTPCIVGVPTMGAVIAPIMSYKKGWPLAVVRQHKKDHGIGNDIEGTLSNKILIVDDVITSGSSIVELREKYIRPRFGTDFTEAVYVITDREAHTFSNVQSLMTLQEIRDHKPASPKFSVKATQTGRFSCQG